MTKVFIGGSRHVSRLTAPVLERLHTIMEKELSVIVGDANGADKAVQNYFSAKVTRRWRCFAPVPYAVIMLGIGIPGTSTLRRTLKGEPSTLRRIG